MSKLLLRYNPVSEIIELHFKNNDLSNYLSNSVAQNQRTWDKNEKCWVILPGVLGRVIVYSRHLFTQIEASSLPVNFQKRVQKALQGNYEEDFSEEKNKLSTPTNPNSPYSILYLQPNAPDFVVKAVYKALVFKHHPDKGGNSERFQQVKDAYEAIQNEFGK